MTQRHYTEYGTDPQGTRHQLVRAGAAEAMHDVDTIDTILLLARQPHARAMDRDAVTYRRRYTIRAIICLCVLGLIAVKVML